MTYTIGSMSIVGVEHAEQNLKGTESYAPRGVGFAALRGGSLVSRIR